MEAGLPTRPAKELPMTIIATSNMAYIVVGLAVPIFGFLGLWIQSTRIKKEVSSPNGQSSGNALYESRKMLVELREQMAEVREAQLAGWERAHADTDRAAVDRTRLEAKVDQIALTQEEHLDRDDARFRSLFDAAGINDPIE
jgi:hypothetical protein